MLAASFWDVLWYLIVAFVLINAIVVLFAVVYDLFSDHEETGLSKAIWIIFLLVVPIISIVVYLIVRGDGIGKRTLARDAARDAAVPPPPATMNPATELTQAKQLLDSGAINQEEWETMKRRILA